MPAIAAIKCVAASTVRAMYSSNAGAASDFTFSPDGFLPNGIARWVDRSGGIEIGYPSLILNFRRPVLSNGQGGERMFKIMGTIRLPTLEVTSPSTASGIQPAPTLAYAHGAKFEFMLPARGTSAERKKLLDLFVSLFTTTLYASDGDPSEASLSPVVAAVESLEPVFGS